MRYLLRNVNKEGRTITITTHSPYLLSALNNSLFAGSLFNRYGVAIEKSLSAILPKESWLSSNSCSVYSLGEKANGDATYCKSVVDMETGMIDSNALDGASLLLSEEFSKVEDALLNL